MFWSNSIKILYQKSSPKKIASKHGSLTAKRCRNGNKLMPKPINKSMPKLVPKTIMDQQKHNVFPNGKIFQIHCKTIFVEGLASCVLEQKRHQKTIPKSIPKSMQNLCSRKPCNKYRNILKNNVEIPKTIKHLCRNLIRKKVPAPVSPD